MTAREELHNILAKSYDLEDMAAELETIAAAVYVLGSTVQPIPRPDGNPSKATTEAAIDSIYHHIIRIADTLNAIQTMVNKSQDK
jgi:hypothetical protein